MTWMLLSLYNTIEKCEQWLEWGKNGLDFIEEHCIDTDGQLFFHVTRDGRPIRKRRYAFSESFAAIAHAAYARARGCEHSAKRAMELFEQFTCLSFTPGLLSAKFSDSCPMIGMAPRMITIATAQELRANLGEDKRLTDWIDRCIEDIRCLFVKPQQAGLFRGVKAKIL